MKSSLSFTPAYVWLILDDKISVFSLPLSTLWIAILMYFVPWFAPVIIEDMVNSRGKI